MTYAEYLELESLLRLQQPRSVGPAPDELLFIVIHQAYELWFKLMLHEADRLRSALEAGQPSDAAQILRRLNAIQRLLNGQIEVLETMTPAGFAAFRDRLENASGFQSYQFREVEIVFGKRDPTLLAYHPEGSPARERLERRMEQPSVYTAFLRCLARLGHPIPDEAVERTIAGREGGPEVRRALLGILRADPSPALEISEAMVDLDERIQEWRYRHVKMVERTIGDKPGTGGSSGVDYLRSSLFKPFFPDLWRFRDKL